MICRGLGSSPNSSASEAGELLRAALPIRFSKAGFGGFLWAGPPAGWQGWGGGVENTQEDVLGSRSFEAHGKREIYEAKEEKQV